MVFLSSKLLIGLFGFSTPEKPADETGDFVETVSLSSVMSPITPEKISSKSRIEYILNSKIDLNLKESISECTFFSFLLALYMVFVIALRLLLVMNDKYCKLVVVSAKFCLSKYTISQWNSH